MHAFRLRIEISSSMMSIFISFFWGTATYTPRFLLKPIFNHSTLEAYSESCPASKMEIFRQITPSLVRYSGLSVS